MTSYLQMSIALNKLDWAQIEVLSTELTISQQELMEIYEESNKWVEDTSIQQ